MLGRIESEQALEISYAFPVASGNMTLVVSSSGYALSFQSDRSIDRTEKSTHATRNAQLRTKSCICLASLGWSSRRYGHYDVDQD